MEYAKKNVWKNISDNKEVFDFSNGYINFLNLCKTERETVEYLEKRYIKEGYANLLEINKINKGDKFYLNHRGKVFIVGTVNEELIKGFKLIAAHIDSPRLDLKGQPLFEEEGICLLKTHYYGGIKKYQWTTIPLAIHGVVYTKSGEKITLKIGEKDSDPIFTITDLLPHLGKDQGNKKLSLGIEGEQLNILCGHMPRVSKDESSTDDEKSPLKKYLLEVLKEEYGIDEEDFLRSEIEIVPGFKARDIGFDRSFVGGYGQDDRVCAYALSESFLNSNQKGNNLGVFFDKEEIGSSGDTGAKSRVIEYVIELIRGKVDENVSNLEILFNSIGISSDVSACDDPSYPGIFDKLNKGTVGNGVIISKYTGSGGKYDSNDASAEYVSKIMNIFDSNNVVYQFGELGKVDQGGGGTIAQYLSALGIKIIDVGTGLLSMHSPFEVSSKGDVYMTYKGYKGFYEYEDKR